MSVLLIGYSSNCGLIIENITVQSTITSQMESNRTQIKLEELASHVDELLNRFQLMQADHNTVKEENKKLKSLLEEKNQLLNDFQYKSKISKIVQYLAVDDLSAEELRTKIDEYIKEIDNCLAYLSREV